MEVQPHLSHNAPSYCWSSTTLSHTSCSSVELITVSCTLRQPLLRRLSNFEQAFRIHLRKTGTSEQTLIYQRTHQYDDVHPSLHQQVQSVFVVLPGADGGPTQQLFARVFGGQRVVPVLLQISPGNNGHQLVVIIYNRKLAWWK